MSETKLMREIQIAVSELGHRVWRNNCGVFLTQNGDTIQTGLCRGSADLVGLMKDGRFLAIEVKMPKGYVAPIQKDFIKVINEMGGVAFVARSVDDVKNMLSRV